MTALVLGGSTGIGAAVVRALHRDGHRVAIGFHDSEDAAQKLALEVDGVGVSCDVTTEAGVLAAFDGPKPRWDRSRSWCTPSARGPTPAWLTSPSRSLTTPGPSTSRPPFWRCASRPGV